MIGFSKSLDTVCLSVPLLIRLLEFAREDARSDIALHKIAERASGPGRLDMSDYERLVRN